MPSSPSRAAPVTRSVSASHDSVAASSRGPDGRPGIPVVDSASDYSSSSSSNLPDAEPIPEQPPQRPTTLQLFDVVNDVVSSMTDLQADLVSRQARGFPYPESLLDPTDAETTDVAEDLAKLLAEAEAKLSYEQARADHAEQIVEAQISFLNGQDNTQTPPHSSPAHSARADTPAPSKILIYLERIQH